MKKLAEPGLQSQADWIQTSDTTPWVFDLQQVMLTF